VVLFDLGAYALSTVCRRRRGFNRQTQTLRSHALVGAFFDDDAGEPVGMGRQPVRAFMSSKKPGEPTPASAATLAARSVGSLTRTPVDR
jgi:hypothetical protein